MGDTIFTDHLPAWLLTPWGVILGAIGLWLWFRRSNDDQGKS